MIVSFQFWLYDERFTCLKWNMQRSAVFSPFQWHCTYCCPSKCYVERNRPDFKGEFVASYVDGKNILHFRSSGRNCLFLGSIVISAIWLLFATAALIIIYWVHYNLINTPIDKYSQWVTSGLTALQIFIFNLAYRAIAAYLTELENHQFEESFYNSLVIKIFSFQFVTTSMSFYYLAFFANLYSEYLFRNASSWGSSGYPDSVFSNCGYYDCMQSLTINLLVITGLPLLTSLLWDFDFFHDVFVALPKGCFSFLSTPVYSRPQPQRDRPSSSSQDFIEHQHHYDEESASQNQNSGSRNNMTALQRQRSDNSVSGHNSQMLNPLSPMRGGGVRRQKSSEMTRQQSQLRQKQPLSNDLLEDSKVSDIGDSGSGGMNDVGITAEALATLNERRPIDIMHREHSGSATATDMHPNQQPHSSPDVQYHHVYGERSDVLQGTELFPSLVEAGDRDATAAVNGRETALLGGEGEEGSLDDTAALQRHISMAQLQQTRSFTRCGGLLTCQSKLFSLLAVAFCFGSAFPGVFVVLMIYCWCEMKGRSLLLLTKYRRPVIFTPNCAGMEAIWKDMFEVIIFIVIFTNGALVIYTMDTFQSWSMEHRLELFIAYVLVLSIFRWVLYACLQRKADAEVSVHQARAELINRKLILREPDKENDIHLQML